MNKSIFVPALVGFVVAIPGIVAMELTDMDNSQGLALAVVSVLSFTVGIWWGMRYEDS